MELTRSYQEELDHRQQQLEKTSWILGAICLGLIMGILIASGCGSVNDSTQNSSAGIVGSYRTDDGAGSTFTVQLQQINDSLWGMIVPNGIGQFPSDTLLSGTLAGHIVEGNAILTLHSQDVHRDSLIRKNSELSTLRWTFDPNGASFKGTRSGYRIWTGVRQ